MNLELRLLAVMLKTGKFEPILRSEITAEHFETDEGQVLFNFITTYRRDSDGIAKFPSLEIVRARFARSAVELPDPDPGDTVENLAYEVQGAYFRSQLRQFSLEAEQLASSSGDPVHSVASLVTKLRRATERQQRVPHISLATGLPELVETYRRKEVQLDGIPFPWPSLTKETRGLQPGELTILCGRPKSRKTFTALRIGTHAVLEHRQRVLVLSPEMPAKQMFLRCAAHFCNLPYRELKDGSLAPEDEERLYAMASRFGRAPKEDDESYGFRLQQAWPDVDMRRLPSLDIVQSAGRDMQWVAAQIELHRPSLVIADSFYLQRGAGQKKGDSDWKAITAASREMKQVAMEYGVSIVATHQLNREAQRSVGDLTNLALADAVGQDADGIYRVVTGKREGEDVSALILYGGREIVFDGVLIANRPCYDYSELGIITSRKTVLELMRQEEAADEAEQATQQEAFGSPHTASGTPRVVPGRGRVRARNTPRTRNLHIVPKPEALDRQQAREAEAMAAINSFVDEES